MVTRRQSGLEPVPVEIIVQPAEDGEQTVLVRLDDGSFIVLTCPAQGGEQI